MAKRRERGPMPTVKWDGRTYCVRSRKIAVPDLTAMTRFAALSWLIANTYSRGHSRPNPLAGFGGALAVSSR